jgi:hypothetical protein
LNEYKNSSTMSNDNEHKQASSLISTDTDVKDETNIISSSSPTDEPFYEASINEESSTSTPAAHTSD